MGQIFSHLTNQGITLPNGQFQSEAQAQNTIPDPSSMLGGVGDPTYAPSSTQGTFTKPSFLQALQYGSRPGSGMANPLSPELSKGGKLLALIGNGLQGALAGRAAQEQTIAASGGRRAGGIGTGFEAGYQLPFLRQLQQQQVQRGGLENQLLQNQVQYAPQLNFLNMLKAQSENFKNTAEGNKANAEAGAVPTKTALEQAQTEAAYYKDDPNVGLIDLRSGQPVNSAGLAPLSPEEAAILGKQPGERVPLKLANTANEMVNRGIRTVQANGRSLLVDNKGNTIKDMGAATPLVVMQNQLGAAGNPQSPEFQAVVDAVGQGKMDLQTAAGRMGRFPGAAFALMGAVEQKYPNYFQGNYDSAKRVLESFTSGSYSQNLNAIDTARRHMSTFSSLAKDLGNGNVRAFNALGNALGIQFGSDKATNFNMARDFFSGEVGKAVVNGGGTAQERDKLADAISTSSSWKQLAGALKTADALLSGKQEALKNTYQSGRQGTPNFGQGGTSGNRPPLSSFEK